MDNYIFSADLLNKFSQLTPWVQAVIGLGFFGVLLGICYFVMETIKTITSSFKKDKTSPKQEEEKVL